MRPRWRLAVDPVRCIGSGTCIATAPDRFAYDAHQRSTPVTTPVEPDDDVLDAAASCPLQAITVTDDETGEPVDFL